MARRTVTGSCTDLITGVDGTGTVILRALPRRWTSEADGELYAAPDHELTLVGGDWSAALIPTDEAGIEPATGRYYQLEERIDGVPVRVRTFELPTGDGSPVDILGLVVADPALPGYVRGATGPEGPEGPEGPQPELGAAGAGADIALRSTDPTTTNARTPLAHAASHAAAGADPVLPAAIGAETPAAAQTKADAAQAAAEATAAAALAAHAADGTAVHGIADTAALETTAGATAKVSAHSAASDPHGDRADAAARYVPLLSILAAVKSADEQVTSSIVLQDDDHLVLSVAAGATYALDAYLDVEADPAADITLGWSAPAGATLSWTESGISAGNAGNIGSIKQSRLDLATSSGVGIISTGSVVRPAGVLKTAGTAGTLQMRWAQSVSSGTPTTLKAGSWIRLTRIA